ncbi:MAG: glycosyl hydrolase, partial [Gemmatimonadales bacterium]|nr:glycosyl hydrolase [Gemmatimonadales bacterium]NIN12245.1 glycosyl hydrolase [Gemmatimonadales bacterium]NIQ99368.1 glycosyl hydrolase [Gemmatimonadales bacterium]NIS64049.1 glycosyl hydrolase [Gemmatimonadales bacterium]
MLTSHPRTVFTAILTTVAVASTLINPNIAQAQRGRGGAAQSDTGDQRDPLAAAVRGLRFRSIGPAVISGRISDLAVHKDKKTWYVATASGGVWKTTNAGTSFSPIMDGEGSYSFGVVVIDPNDPDVIWVGSGENNPQRSVAYGDGVYKSVDAGRTWRNVGLPNSEHIAKILIDPRNSDVVYVAAQGPVFNSGGDRGLYKTTDGGETWTRILEANEWTGVTDVVMDPRNPDVLIAATWQRARRQWGLILGGPGSGVHRSTDGGATWSRSQRGLPSAELGRIGLAMSPVDPDVVYAIIEARERSGFYRSQNNGISWQRMSDRRTSSNYYQEIFADPVNVDRVYVMDVRISVSDDGGRNWRRLGGSNKHVDNHALWIDPDDTDHLLIGCDGGLYETFDGGQTYDWFQNLPLAQFYRLEVDSVEPFYRVFGGTQDNSTMGGPSRTRTSRGADNGDWFLTRGGDGFYTRVDPTNPNIVYSESQYAGLIRLNLATGERVSITPQPEPGEPALRWHWDSPLIISPHAPSRLYFAAQRAFRSDDRGSSWTPVSGDLSRQIDRNRLKMMGRVWGVDAVGKNRSTSTWNSIVTLAESPLQEGLLWVGTDDGLIHVTEDGGENWRRIESVRGVPDTTFISRVTPSVHDVNTVYVSFDNHKAGDYKPYIARSTDLGRSWRVISEDLPERGTVYVVLEDYQNPNLLYAGTEFGAFFSHNGGEDWTRLRSGLPTIQVRDMALQTQHDDLVLATFGRGFYILDDLETLRRLTPEVVASDVTLLPVDRTPLFVLWSPDPGWQGGRFWTADNPPMGARIFY